MREFGRSGVNTRGLGQNNRVGRLASFSSVT